MIALLLLGGVGDDRTACRGTVGLIGPDGVGKSTLLAILAGTKRVQPGVKGATEVRVFGGDFTLAAHRCAVYARIAYMPQGLGRNLYPNLTARETLPSFRACLSKAMTNAHSASPICSLQPVSRRSPTAPPGSSRAECARNSACAAR